MCVLNEGFAVVRSFAGESPGYLVYASPVIMTLAHRSSEAMRASSKGLKLVLLGSGSALSAQTAAHSSKAVLQCPRMPEPDASKAVLTLLNVLVDGSGPEGSMVLNRNDPGLLKSLSLVSAEQASAIAPSGGSSIAAHVDHLRYLLELLNRWSRGEPDVFENAAFGTSWTRSTVSAEEWAARCEALAREAHAWARAIDRPTAPNGPGIDVVIASAVHLAYHLGAIRQINGLLRGPAARD